MTLRLLCALLTLGLASCAGADAMTSYQGGVRVEPGADGTTLVRAFGNGFTPQAAVEDYVWLKAAELTLQEGRSCFTVVASGSQMNDISASIAYAGTTHYNMPTARLRIRPTDKTADCGEGDAKAIVERLSNKVKNRSVYFEK